MSERPVLVHPAEWEQLAPYLPRVALEWPDDRGWQTVPASLVFADVSGFTALSEKLARRGSIGAEELTHTLGTVFASMLDSAYVLGGSLLKFGGDALLLMFDGDDHPWRAATAARSLRRAARQLGQIETSVGRLRIRASIGAHTGEVTFFRAGRLHKELIVAGPAVSETLAMEGAASAGEVLLSPAICAEIDQSLLDAEKGPGRLLSDRAMAELSGSFPPVPPPREDPAVSIPHALRDHLIDAERTSEHRMVTVGFFKFSGLDDLLKVGVEHAAGAVDELVTRVQASAADCGVTFLGSDVDTDGGKIVLTAGAPIANPDDSARMVAALRRVLAEPSALRIRAGVHRGKVFAGDIGPAYRRTYTVMGDAVNTAARVMASATDGELLVSPVVAGQVVEVTGFGEPRHVRVKGKAKPLEVVPVDAGSGPQAVQAESTELIGRGPLLDQLRRLSSDLREGRGAVVEVRGEAGVGKSALVRALSDFEGVASTLVVVAEPYGGDTAWGLARRVLEAAVRSFPAAGSVEEALAKALSAPGFEGSGGLLADVVPTMSSGEVDVPGHLRRAATEKLINEVLAHMVGPSVALIIEEIHTADDASLGWLRRLAAEAAQRGWLVALTRRGDGDPVAEWAHQLEVGPLSDADSRLLVKNLSLRALRPREMARLVEQGAGNPLFLRELVLSASVDGELPDSVGAAFAGRIDRLAPGDARLLRAASVLGTHFDPSDLAALTQSELPSASALVKQWGSLVERDGDQLRFTSPLARDAAYDALPHRVRGELHGRAAQVLTAREGADKNLALLSVHLERAGLWRRCWKVSKSAAIRAGRVDAAVEAAGLFERAIRAGMASSVGPDELAKVWWRAGNEWHRANYLDRALDAYRSARTLTQSSYAKASIGMSEARIAELKGEPLAATRRVRQALRVLGVTERQELRLKADLEVMHGWVSVKRGRIKDARRWASIGLDDAIASGNTAAQAEARLLAQWCASQAGQPVDEDELKRAARLFQRVKNSSRAAFSLNILGAVAYYRGDWDSAGKYYAEAMAMYEKAGHEAEAASARYNAAEILLDQGNLSEAEDVLEQVCDLYQAVGYRSGLSLVERDRGRIALRRGDFGQARQRLSGAREQFEEQQAAARVLEVDAWLAELDLSEQNTDEARTRLVRAVEKARSEGVGTVLPMLLRLQGYAHLAEGELDSAAQAFAESLELARSVGGLYDVAMALSAEAEMAERQEGKWPESSRRERDELLSRLGMTEAPAPLLGNRGPAS